MNTQFKLDNTVESEVLTKEVIRQHTSSIDSYGEVPANFKIIEWTAEDDCTVITYSFHDTAIGKLLIANTFKGVCFLGFVNNDESGIKKDFTHRYPHNRFEETISDLQKQAVEFCNGNHTVNIPLHLKGTVFQLSIWEKLLRIPEGKLSTYGSLSIKKGGSQAVGGAVGANPVSYIIPCHRIVRNDGSYHGYHWGLEIKRMLLTYELQKRSL